MHSLTRRDLLSRSRFGLGGIALAWLLNQTTRSGGLASERPVDQGLLPSGHARAQRVIQVFCAGGVSHIDTFDYKPELEKNDGKAMSGKGKVDTFFGQPGNLMKSRFAFRQHGACGHWVSDLLPHLATCVDDMTFIHSMVARSSNHTPATFQMNSGFTMNGFP
jgi:hypothetical protein